MGKEIQSTKNELVQRLQSERPAAWDQIPDIDLYKDQLTEYLKRQHIGFALGMEEPLTSAMINNYIKVGVLPRAKGKRYDREHIAYLTAVALLKQVLSVQETGDLLKLSIDRGEDAVDEDDVKSFYEKYSDLFDETMKAAVKELKTAKNEDEIRELALSMAVRSYADKLVARELIAMMAEETK